MTTLRLQSRVTNRGPTRYTVNLDGVPLGCDGLFKDPALVITVGSEVAKVPHNLRDDGAMMFSAAQRYVARYAAGVAMKDYAANQERLNRGVHFDREESQKLRELAEYCMRGHMGEHAHTVTMILAKVPR